MYFLKNVLVLTRKPCIVETTQDQENKSNTKIVHHRNRNPKEKIKSKKKYQSLANIKLTMSTFFL